MERRVCLSVSFDYYDRRLCFVSLVVQVEYSNTTQPLIYIFVSVSTIEEIKAKPEFLESLQVCLWLC